MPAAVAERTSSRLISDLEAVLGPEGLIHRKDELVVYECDGYVIEKNVPDVVVFPTTTAQVVEVVKLCNEYDVPFVPRGAGTSLAGGTLAVGGGVMISLTRMRRILEVNTRDRYAVVEPGVVNIWLAQGPGGHRVPLRPRPVEPGGLHHRRKRRDQLRRPAHAEIRRHGQPRPRPGAGPARRHRRRDGRDRRGAPRLRPDRPDRRQRGDVRRLHPVTVALTRDPEAGRTLLGVFESVDAATETVSDIIAAGIVPAALEMLDTLMIQAVEQAFGFGFPTDAGAVLIIEIDGLDAGLDDEAAQDRRDRPRPGRLGPEVDPLADPQGARLRRDLEEPQVGLRRHRPPEPQLLHPGRRRPPHQAPAHPARHHGDRREVRPPHRQRLPRRRRQHPPDPALQRARPRPGPPGPAGQPRDPGGVRRRGRQRDGRARHRRREAGIHAEAVHAPRTSPRWSRCATPSTPRAVAAPRRCSPAAAAASSAAGRAHASPDGAGGRGPPVSWRDRLIDPDRPLGHVAELVGAALDEQVTPLMFDWRTVIVSPETDSTIAVWWVAVDQ